jgi:anti-anti-sigma factor
MTESSSHLNVEEVGGIVVACFAHQPQFASFDLAKAFDSLLEPVSQCSTQSLLVDMTPVVYLDSSSLGELARLKRRVEEGGGKMALCNVSSTLHEILTVILFDKLFTIFDDQASATAWISTDDSE